MPRKNKKSVAKEEVDYHSLLSYFTHILFDSYYYPLNSSHKCNRPSHLRNYDPKFNKSIFLGSQIA